MPFSPSQGMHSSKTKQYRKKIAELRFARSSCRSKLFYDPHTRQKEAIVLNGKPVFGEALANSFHKYFVGLVPPNRNKVLSVNSCTVNANTVQSCFFLPMNVTGVPTFASLVNSNVLGGLWLKVIKCVVDLIAPVITYLFFYYACNKCLSNADGH